MQIIPIQFHDRRSVVDLYKSVTNHLLKNGNDQWDRFYPNVFIIRNDLKKENLYGVKVEDVIIAAVVVDENQSGKYNLVNWLDQKGKPACIHRLAVHPKYQGKGLGKALLKFAEEKAIMNGCSSIRLDVYSANPEALGMYRRAEYKETGVITFPLRKLPYYCFEKVLKH